tara:strand:+ start:188 stop:646 length:459 start_codon:yes stop_codon:yes gene_type:complete
LLITETGEQKGIVSIEEAINLANEAELDLVEISPNAKPPVCKILDFGKYRFEKQKKKKLNKKKQHVVHVKEIRIRPNTGDHDLITKVNKGQKFLLNGDKLKITVMFRGREMTRKEAGVKLLNKVAGILEEIAEIDKDSNLEGRRMSIVLRPR